MKKSSSSGAQAKVFYRPIEAAIQWAGLSRFERRILDVAKGMNRLPEHPELARWPQLLEHRRKPVAGGQGDEHAQPDRQGGR